MEDQKIKVGIYTSGTSVRIIGECDLITQSSGHRDEAIYLTEIPMMRDPRTPFTTDEINKLVTSVKQSFKESKYQFKAKDRKEAELFLKSKITDRYTAVREFSEV